MKDYVYPEPIKTDLRCKFSLPKRKYNCRSLGRFVLNGKGYCALHYGTVWSVQNPIQGQAHEWHIHVNRFTGDSWPYETCRKCGSIRQHDGLPQNPCGGKQPEIRLWAAS